MRSLPNSLDRSGAKYIFAQGCGLGSDRSGTDTTRGDRQPPEKLNYSSYSRLQAYEVLSISPVGTLQKPCPYKS